MSLTVSNNGRNCKRIGTRGAPVLRGNAVTWDISRPVRHRAAPRRPPGPAARAPPVNCGRGALPAVVCVPYAGAVPDGGRHGNGGEAAGPPSSSGLGHRPFKAAARVRIPLGAPAGISWQTHGPVEQLGVLATLSRWRSRVQIPSGPLGKSGGTVSPPDGQVAQLVRASA